MQAIILGGTGTLGQAVTERLLSLPGNSVLCISRDELKQKQLQERFQGLNFRSVLGDIRDYESIYRHLSGADVVFHFAALKHVDVIEENPEESINTNILGTINASNAAIAAQVPFFVFSSTDKAVDPINVYGMCKAVSEKLLLERNNQQSGTKHCVFRWGNVIGSRGSVIHSFAKTLKEQGKVYLTETSMTRFWIPIEDAVTFMLDNFQTMPWDEVYIPDILSAPVVQIADLTAKALGIEKYETVITGLRRGEKLHEMLRSRYSLRPLESDGHDRHDEAKLFQMIKNTLGIAA